MSHQTQQEYCARIKERFPEYFFRKTVLDVGSLDINGCNRDLFIDCNYIGIDIEEGNNVDVVGLAHELQMPDNYFDTIVSTECFEHDMFWERSLWNIVRMLDKGGLFFFTCATEGRGEHGTKKSSPSCSPFTSKIPEWEDYYRNLTEEDIRKVLDIDLIFMDYQFSVKGTDLRFWGIKR